MEDSVFPSEAVASLMKEHVVEGRLHTDTKNTLTEAQFARNREVQDTVAGTKANPYFVMVDPETGDTIEEFSLSGDWTTWPTKWIAFVESAARKSGRKLGE